MFDASRFADPAGQTYGSFLILPVQRMASVINATKVLNKYTDEQHVDKAAIQKAYADFEEASAAVDKSAVKYKELERLERGIEFVESSKGGSWVIPSLKRQLLKRQPVLDGDVTRELVVMSDMIMLLGMEKTTGRPPKQAVEHSFHVDDGITCNADVTKLEFTLAGPGFSYTLRAPNTEEFGAIIGQALADCKASPQPSPLCGAAG